MPKSVRGVFELWGTGEANGKLPAFVLSWGLLSNRTAEGRMTLAAKPAVVHASRGSATLSWFSYGLPRIGREGLGRR